MSESTSSASAVVHSLPCRINHNGPAHVKAFFESTRQPIGEGEGRETAAYRGRPLYGQPLPMAEGYSLCAVRTQPITNNPGPSTISTAQIVSKGTNCHYWNLDQDTHKEDPIQQAINYATLAEQLMKD